MRKIGKDEWVPRGVSSLEETASDVVRSHENMLVVAGPGAGKTELLAQRACYLLETQVCVRPKRILAISFKRDAAANLAERVSRRCAAEADRFDSLTLDAFGKNLVDRFRCAIPESWRPAAGYEPELKSPTPGRIREWFLGVTRPHEVQETDFRGMGAAEIKKCFERSVIGHQLPYSGLPANSRSRFYGMQWWKESLAIPAGRPSLTFAMLNRLAAFLLRQNPKLRRAIQSTYSFVFLDEFQDTTEAQYDLICSAFQYSPSIVTAVGDSKQRIMTWAGAMPDAFGRLTSDFSASTRSLVRNYRSTPELVAIQSYIASAIDKESAAVEATRASDADSACHVLEFASPEQEASYLANLVKVGLANGLQHRDFCFLSRQKVPSMIRFLVAEFTRSSMRIRDESQLQDLLKEPASEICLAILRLATRERDPDAWETVTRVVAQLSDDRVGGTSRASDIVNWTRSAVEDEANLGDVLVGIVRQLGRNGLQALYRQYSSDRYLDDCLELLGKELVSADATAAGERVDALLGSETVPAMSVHKSKGLEFHTVVFMGLEDAQLWNFANQSEEEICGFFVAFSRAIQRVVFTFSETRDDQRHGRTRQRRHVIGDLYGILESAGVEVVDCRDFNNTESPAPGLTLPFGR